jgi:hypothetical protein
MEPFNASTAAATVEYAQLHRTTAGAVLARIDRGTLKAIPRPGPASG